MRELLIFYEAEHQDWRNRWLHHAAHGLAVSGALMLIFRPLLGVAMIAASLLVSWLGHAVFERNTPAFFDRTDRGGIRGGAGKKLAVALGGIVWSGACALRWFGLGPLSLPSRRSP